MSNAHRVGRGSECMIDRRAARCQSGRALLESTLHFLLLTPGIEFMIYLRTADKSVVVILTCTSRLYLLLVFCGAVWLRKLECIELERAKFELRVIWCVLISIGKLERRWNYLYPSIVTHIQVRSQVRHAKDTRAIRANLCATFNLTTCSRMNCFALLLETIGRFQSWHFRCAMKSFVQLAYPFWPWSTWISFSWVTKPRARQCHRFARFMRQ